MHIDILPRSVVLLFKSIHKSINKHNPRKLKFKVKLLWNIYKKIKYKDVLNIHHHLYLHKIENRTNNLFPVDAGQSRQNWTS